jgi:hypothetical protein
MVSSSPTPCNVSLCGKVLTISNDGKQVVIADTVSATPQAYIFNAGNNSEADLVLADVPTAAAFSNDQSKIFLLTQSGLMYVFSTVDAMTPATIGTSAAQVAFSANGSFAYVTGTPAATLVSGFATCDTPTTNLFNNIPISGASVALYPMPNLGFDAAGTPYERVLVLDPPNVDTFAVNVSQAPLPDGQFTCVPPAVALDPTVPATSINLGQGQFVPLHSRLAADGATLVIVAQKIPAVLLYSVANGTVSSVPLVNNGDPLAASSSTDGSQVYVAACDQYQADGTTCAAGSVHIINTISQGDFQQVPFINNGTNNMCNNAGGQQPPLCVANMIAVKPQ